MVTYDITRRCDVMGLQCVVAIMHMYTALCCCRMLHVTFRIYDYIFGTSDDLLRSTIRLRYGTHIETLYPERWDRLVSHHRDLIKHVEPMTAKTLSAHGW